MTRIVKFSGNGIEDAPDSNGMGRPGSMVLIGPSLPETYRKTVDTRIIRLNPVMTYRTTSNRTTLLQETKYTSKMVPLSISTTSRNLTIIMEELKRKTEA